MSRAILTCMHAYQPFGNQFYQPILDFFIQQMEKFEGEFDTLYLIEDSNWILDREKIAQSKIHGKIKVVQVNPSLRYYDAYKAVLPQVKEDLVLLMDDDMVVYKPQQISSTFALLMIDKFDVVTIYDTIGDYQTDRLNGKNKFCPYWFATRKELLMKYLDVDWASDMPYCETFGHLTEAMLKDGVTPHEWEEDKSSLYFDRTETGIEWHDGMDKSKDLGYYHIRAGSTPAYLLATKEYGNIDTYNDYLQNQPTNELLRQICWYQYMGGDAGEITYDLGLNYQKFWVEYFNKFKKYHGLI